MFLFVISLLLNLKIMMRNLFVCLCLLAPGFFNHCKDDNFDPNNFIPDGPVSLVINTDLPEYYKLKTPGNYIYAPGGNRGVIVMHNFDDTYIALERTCSFEPDRACSKIYVDSSRATLRCGNFYLNRWDSCCDSRFLYSGQVSQGSAQYNLRTYYTQVSGSVITVRH